MALPDLSWLPNLPPLFVYGGILVGFVVTNLLLAHLLGDLHQPLHVGSIYLDLDGKPVHPDTPGLSDEAKTASETAGGNRLRLGLRLELVGVEDQLPVEWGDENGGLGAGLSQGGNGASQDSRHGQNGDHRLDVLKRFPGGGQQQGKIRGADLLIHRVQG